MEKFNQSPEAFAWLVSFILNTLLAAFVYIKNRKKKLNITFALFSVCIALWSLNVFGSYIFDTDNIAAWEKFSCVGLLFIPPAGFFFMAVLSKTGINKKAVIASFIISSIFLIMNFAGVFVTDFKKVGQKFTPVPNLPYVLFVMNLVFWISSGILKISKSYRISASLQFRNQLKYFFFGILLVLIFGLGNFLFSLGIESLSPGGLASVIFTGLIAYAIVKHNALEIKVIIRKSIFYFTLSASVMAIYCIVVGLFSAVTGHAFFAAYPFWVDAFAAAVSVAVFLPFKDKIQNLIDRIFFKEKINYAIITKEFARTLSLTTGFSKVVDYVVDFTGDVIHPDKTACFIFDEENQQYNAAACRGEYEKIKDLKIKNSDSLVEWLTLNKRIYLSNDDSLLRGSGAFFPDDFSLAAPLMVKNALTGIILLGKKMSDEPYNYDDLEIISALSSQSSAFIENARLYEKMRELEKNLYHTDKMSALGVLASSIAHEVKNPLMAVKTFVDLMPERKKEKAFISNFLKIVPVEISRMNKIINELLEFGRQKETQFSLVRIDSVIESILDLMRHEITKNSISVERRYPDYIPFITADEEQIKQVFLNLILNGIQEMDKSGILLIEIKYLQNAGEIEVKIGDTGRGIDEKTKSSIFKPFFTTKSKGSGLGLAISKRIISQHNGRIEVMPNIEFGTGTLFSVALPASEVTPVQKVSYC